MGGGGEIKRCGGGYGGWEGLCDRECDLIYLEDGGVGGREKKNTTSTINYICLFCLSFCIWDPPRG